MAGDKRSITLGNALSTPSWRLGDEGGLDEGFVKLQTQGNG